MTPSVILYPLAFDLRVSDLHEALELPSGWRVDVLGNGQDGDDVQAQLRSFIPSSDNNTTITLKQKRPPPVNF